MTKIHLEVVSGPNQGQSFAFDARTVTYLGRSLRCDCCLTKDTDVSRTHLQLDIDPPQCQIRDLGSKNHTFINGQQVTSGELLDGDLLQLGPNTKILVQVEGLPIDHVYEEEDQFAASV